MFTLAIGCMVAGLGAAPATPSHTGIDQTIARIRAEWARPGAPAQPNAPGWNTFFDALASDLSSYSTARTEGDRLRALGRLYQMWNALGGVVWRPGIELRQALQTWLQPRVGLAWALRRLTGAIGGLPPTSDADTRANREQWVRFTDDVLGKALREYEGAPTVTAKLAALGRVHAALAELQKGNHAHPWGPAQSLESAVNRLYALDNIDIAADAATAGTWLSRPVVEEGPIYREGLVSHVTAGPRTGFGLLASDDGISFFNSQLMQSQTPITYFNQQMAADPKGRRVTKLYHFDAASADRGEVFVTTTLRPSGLSVDTQTSHNVSANITSSKVPGNGLGRALAAVLGFNQAKITRKVWEGAIGQITQGVYRGSREESAERKTKAEAEENARLRQYLIGNNTLVYRNFAVEHLSLRSRPQFALIGGLVEWRGAGEQRGADLPKPTGFAAPGAGVSADVHLGSLMTNLTRGFLQSDRAKDVKNLMIVTRKVSPGTPLREGIVTTANVDYATFLTAVADAQAVKDPRVLAIRVKRPGRSPEFSADKNGFLVALVHDFSLEIPAPPDAPRALGPPSRIYRIEAADAEFAISFRIAAAEEKLPVRLSGRIEGFDPGPRATVYGINDDESKATQLNNFSAALIVGIFAGRLKGQPVDVPLGNVAIPGFALTDVSPLDPSGWLRVVLKPSPQADQVPQVASGGNRVLPQVAPGR
jgi:hypothetical protein